MLKRLLKHAEEKAHCFFTPMWASNWKDMGAPGNKQEDMTTVHDSFKRHHIKPSVKMKRNMEYNDPSFEQNMNKFAEIFGLEITSPCLELPIGGKMLFRCKKCYKR